MTKYRLDYPYRMDERGGGRTTKMLIGAVELAQSPQNIIVLMHSHDYARTAFNDTIRILDDLGPELGHLGFVPKIVKTGPRTNRYMLEMANGATIFFYSVYSQFPHGLTDFHRTSIMIDHYADDLYIGTGGYSTAYRYWQEVIRTIQSYNADKEITA